jgi:hypothetical protein
MKPDDSFAQVTSRLNAGDDTAAAEVVRRFTHRLIGLARLRLDAAEEISERLDRPRRTVYRVLERIGSRLERLSE